MSPMKKKNIIFLDIDGVLNFWGNMGEHMLLCSTRCMLLNLLVDITESKIVISSTWRSDESCKEKLNHFGIHENQFHTDWRTGFDPQRFRGNEIQEWVHGHKDEILNYVIIDDDGDFLEHQLPYHIKTSMSVGFTPKHFKDSYNILMKGNEND